MMLTGMHSFGYGRGMMGPGMMLGGVIAWLLFLAAIFLVVYLVVRAIKNKENLNNLISGTKNNNGAAASAPGSNIAANQKPDPALEALKMRLVKGEISKQEYMELKNVLLGLFPEDEAEDNSDKTSEQPKAE